MVEKDIYTKYLGKNINNYTITKYINSGSFGIVYEAQDRKTGDFVALKIPIKSKERDGQKCILDEAKVYNTLNDTEMKGIAKMKVIKNKDLKIIVMDLLGPSLENLLKIHKQFRLKSVILLAIQLLDIMKNVHSK